jgi:hypothetical protein
MLDGLQIVLNQGYFTQSKTQKETEIEFQRTSDTIAAFLNELAVFDKNFVTTRSETLEAYKNYCDTFGLTPENEHAFTQRLKSTPKISISRTKGERSWKGITFKKIDDDGVITSTHSTDSTLLPHCGNFTEKVEESNRSVPSVPSVPAKESNLISATRFKPQPGIKCQVYEHDEPCILDAEFNINGNLCCPTHFEAEKENLRTAGKVVCVEMAKEGET